ncbi:hypothetical protein [Streptomyces sp. NPDC058394]|uniref:hypothetical protein n=1 Tax=Streptomyces sp. NPDC058394 TaxID=3346477 RepID=UPI00364F117E
MGRRGRRAGARHADKAAWMREHPLKWLEITTYGSANAAAGAVAGITRNAPGSLIARFYGPAGAFETQTTKTDMGTTVHARYIGGPLA